MKTKAMIYSLILNILFYINLFSQNNLADAHLFPEVYLTSNTHENQFANFESPKALNLLSSISDFQVNKHVGNSSKADIKSAINDNGISIVVWSDSREGTRNVYAQLISSSGQLVGQDMKINSLEDLRTYYQPDVSVNNDNQFLIVWSDNRNGSGIYGQLLTENGDFIGENFEIEDENNRSYKIFPTVASNGEEFVVSWSDTRGGSYYDVYAQRLNKDGTKKGVNFIVNSDTQAVSKFNSKVAVDNTGNIFVAWRSTVEDLSNIYSISLDSSNYPISSQIQLSDVKNVSHSDGNPNVSISNSGFIAVWYRYMNNDYNIIGQLIDSLGQRIDSNFIVNDDETSSQLFPSISADSSGNFVVSWYDYRNSYAQIYAQEFINDLPMGTNFKVSEDESNGPKNYVSCDVNNHGQFISAWLDLKEPTEYRVNARLFNSEGNPISSSLRIDNDENSSAEENPSIEVFDDGSFIVVWTDTRYRSSRAYFQRYDSESNPIGNNQSVVGSGTQYYPGIVKLNDGNFLIYWREYTRTTFNQYEIVAQKYFKTGEKIGDKFVVSYDEIKGDVRYVDGVSNGDGEYVITWERRVGSYYRIYAQKYNSQGNAIKNNILVSSDTTTHSLIPKVGIDFNGNFAITYYAYSEGNYEIFLNRYDSDVVKLGNEITVNDDLSKSNQYVPDISINDNGECIVTWFDYRSPFGVYYQKYTNIGSENLFSKIDTNISVADYSMSYCVPKVSINKIGDFAISWPELNDGFSDLKLKVFDNKNVPVIKTVYLSESQNRNQLNQQIYFHDEKIFGVWQSNHEYSVGYDIWANVISYQDLVTNVEDIKEQLAHDHSLSQNYPNPFNPTTTISYNIPSSIKNEINKVSIKVYDVLGKEIKTLVNENQSSGTYKIKFDASNLSSGIYFYTLNVGDLIQTKKMILLK